MFPAFLILLIAYSFQGVVVAIKYPTICEAYRSNFTINIKQFV